MTKEYYIKLARQGEDYLEIKKKLERDSYTREEQRELLREVDRIRLELEKFDLKRRKANENVIIGIILISFGLLVFIGSQYIITTGLIGFGIIVLWRGLVIRNNLSEYDLLEEGKNKKRKFDRFR